MVTAVITVVLHDDSDITPALLYYGGGTSGVYHVRDSVVAHLPSLRASNPGLIIVLVSWAISRSHILDAHDTIRSKKRGHVKFEEKIPTTDCTELATVTVAAVAVVTPPAEIL